MNVTVMFVIIVGREIMFTHSLTQDTVVKCIGIHTCNNIHCAAVLSNTW